MQRVIYRRFSCARPSLSARFNWEDALDLKSALSEDEISISDTAHAFCQEVLKPKVLEGWRTEKFDRNIMREFGDVGLLGPNIQGYGCAGTNNVSYGLIAREVERVDSGYRSAMSVQSSLVMHPINQFGSEELKERLLPKLATGELVGCFGLTEPNHGSDPGAMETVAKRHPTKKGVYLLSGSKTWITNSPIADVLVIWAKLDGEIRGFVIERSKVTGLDTPQIKHKAALRASVTGMIHMDNVEVPEENLFQNVSGLKGPFSCLNSARLGISWGTIGALEEALRLAREYALERKQFGKPLASFQLIQMKLAQALTDANYGLLASLHVTRLKDQGIEAPEMIGMIKRQNCDRALANARTLMEVFGGNASADEYHIAIIAHNLQTVQTYEGQSDIHALALGRRITGIGAFH